MSVNRRDFAKLLGAGVVLSAPKEILPLPEEAHALEVKEGKKYLMVIENCPPENCREIEYWLRSQGLDVIVINTTDMKLYEIERKTE